MRMSRHVGTTLKEDPKEAQIVSHRLMLRAGYMKQHMAGVYTFMPLLHRVIKKVSDIIREEMDAKGAEELFMPALQPKDLWVETDRWERYTDIDGIMFAFKDRRGGYVCLGPTHEEIITDVVRKEIQSYKQLPINLYQIQTKFRDEIRPRFGLMRSREFMMKDAYSFDADNEGLDKSFDDMYDAYSRIFSRCGLHFRAVEADSGPIGGSGSKEFMVLADSGEDTIFYCDKCEYAANSEKAESKLEVFPQGGDMKPMEEVEGKGIIGVEPLAKHLGIPVWHTTKTMLYRADDQMVAVMVRGDCDVNEVKVQNYLDCQVLELASPEMVKKITGAEIGYAGPVGLPEDVKIIADDYVGGRVNFECGANKTDYHNINVNFERDFPTPDFGDFKMAKEGDFCPRCDEGKLLSTYGIEVGHIFKLGTKYSKAMKCFFLNQDGEELPMIMGCYGIGVSRIAAAAIEQNHDENGIIWPLSIAPYQVHLMPLNYNDEMVKDASDKLYKELGELGVEVLYDDRGLRAGAMFGDSDLIGVPYRLVISSKTLENGEVEFQMRSDDKKEMIKQNEAAKFMKDLIAEQIKDGSSIRDKIAA